MKITIKNDNKTRDTHIITLEDGTKIWPNAYLNAVLNTIKYGQIQLAVSNGKIVGIQTMKEQDSISDSSQQNDSNKDFHFTDKN